MYFIDILVMLYIFITMVLFVCISGYTLEYNLTYRYFIHKNKKFLDVVINDVVISVLLILIIFIVI